MYKKAKVEKLTKEDKRSYALKITTHDDSFLIPVIDVRDGINERKQVEAIVKANNIQKGSKYFKTSFSEIGKPYN